MGMIKDFKDFAIKGNMVDMAIGIVLGAAFGTVIKSLVSDVVTPIVASVFNMPDFANLFVLLRAPDALPEGITSVEQITSLTALREAGGVALAYGNFINALIAFVLVALALWVIVRSINNLKKKEEEAPAPAPAGPSELDVLLEIRDSLKK